MHRYLTRACVAAAAGVALSTMGVTGASASGAASRAQQAMQMPLGGRVHAAASPGTRLWVKRYNGSGFGARADREHGVRHRGKHQPGPNSP